MIPSFVKYRVIGVFRTFEPYSGKPILNFQTERQLITRGELSTTDLGKMKIYIWEVGIDMVKVRRKALGMTFDISRFKLGAGLV